MSAPKVTLYWLSNSRAQRILWLLEELEVPYALEKFYRDPTTGLSPAPLKALHPLGSSPLIKVEEADGTSHWISESGAIVQFLCECFAGGKFGVKPSDGLRKYNEYNSWLHWAEGTAIVPAISAILGAYEPRFCAEENQAVVKAAGQAFKAGLLMPRMFSYFKYLDSTMVGKEYLVGDSFTGADAIMMFPVEVLEAVAGSLSEYPNLESWASRMRARPAFVRAEAKGDRPNPKVWL